MIYIIKFVLDLLSGIIIVLKTSLSSTFDKCLNSANNLKSNFKIHSIKDVCKLDSNKNLNGTFISIDSNQSIMDFPDDSSCNNSSSSNSASCSKRSSPWFFGYDDVDIDICHKISCFQKSCSCSKLVNHFKVDDDILKCSSTGVLLKGNLDDKLKTIMKKDKTDENIDKCLEKKCPKCNGNLRSSICTSFSSYHYKDQEICENCMIKVSEELNVKVRLQNRFSAFEPFK